MWPARKDPITGSSSISREPTTGILSHRSSYIANPVRISHTGNCDIEFLDILFGLDPRTLESLTERFQDKQRGKHRVIGSFGGAQPIINYYTIKEVTKNEEQNIHNFFDGLCVRPRCGVDGRRAGQRETSAARKGRRYPTAGPRQDSGQNW